MFLYRNSQRPGEAGLTVFADEVKAAAKKAHLENSGFLVIKIRKAPFAKALPIPATQSRRRRH
jgi:hypothetical protein